ncbi:low molecular weight phosphatase family protein [Steroidobacter flavus]|uniref:protein-tyrosine-phosphatase n=1 Tax=Steroidobacter flavus TaxID=1842136 RepID=A0ABV8T2L3_9GAMM
MIVRLYNALRRRVRAKRAMAAARDASLARIKKGGIKRVLVVCYGNIYRSPFAGVSLRQALSPEIEVRSSGFHRVAGRQSPERHVIMSRARNIDLSSHRSSRVTTEDLQWADIVVLMDRHNWGLLDDLGADHSKLVWLGAFGPGDIEIADPYELDDAHAQRVLDQLEQASRELATRLRASAQVI